MPLYEYHCLDCHDRFEKLTRSENADSVPCPTCGGNRARRLISVFASFSRSTGGAEQPSSMSGGGCGCGGHCSCGGH